MDEKTNKTLIGQEQKGRHRLRDNLTDFGAIRTDQLILIIIPSLIRFSNMISVQEIQKETKKLPPLDLPPPEIDELVELDAFIY